MSNSIDIEDFARDNFAKAGRLIGLDLGTKTIGVALSDGLRSVASSNHVIKRTKFGKDAEALVKFANEQQAIGFVIGLPLNMDSSEGPRVQATRAFVRNMASKSPLPFIFWDERLSTVTAERVMIEADISRAKRASKIDALAASVILQGALDRLSALNNQH